MAQDRCPFCQKAILRTDRECPHCHRPLTGRAMQEAAATISAGGVVVPETFSAVSVLLLLAALALAGAGVFFFAIETTLGAAMIGAAGILAVWARMAQAGAHHQQLLNELRRGQVERIG